MDTTGTLYGGVQTKHVENHDDIKQNGVRRFVSFLQLLGHRDSIVAYTGDVDRIGSPCVDALVEDGTVEQALVFDTREECQTDAVDNEALIAAGVEVCAVCVCFLASIDRAYRLTDGKTLSLRGREKRGTLSSQDSSRGTRPRLFRRAETLDSKRSMVPEC